MTRADSHRRQPTRSDAGCTAELAGSFSRRAWCTVLVLSAVCLLAGMVLAGSASAISPGRVYEMVSPVYKGGFGATQPLAAPDGESVAFYSPGVFAGAPTGLSLGIDSISYLARRGTTGWSSTPLLPPASLIPDPSAGGGHDVSSSLEVALAIGPLGPNLYTAKEDPLENGLLLHPVNAPDVATEWTTEGTVIKTKHPLEIGYLGASADLCHLLFENLYNTESPVPIRAALGTHHVYEQTLGCSGEPQSLHPVGVNNAGQLIAPDCGQSDFVGSPGSGISSRANQFNAISEEGGEVFFSTRVQDCHAAVGEEVAQVFVRIGGSKTLEVSRPLSPACTEVPCGGGAVAAARPSAEFQGASSDGSRVFFTTQAALAESDKDTDNDLYMATIGCPSGTGEACAHNEPGATQVTSLSQVSLDPHVGEAAEVQGVVRVSQNGERVYFVARGDLALKANHEGKIPVVGADNLYVYDAMNGEIEFIGDLCSGSELSGSTQDSYCPSDLSEATNDTQLWSATGSDVEAQTAGTDGEFMVFTSYGRLVSGDADSARDVYRYDAETGVLQRVSLGEHGYDANGNDLSNASIALGLSGKSVAAQYELGSRAINENGSRIVFTTASPLSPMASNGLVDLYEWHEAPGGEGEVSLVSGGAASRPVEEAVITPSGRDVFFVTSESLVPQDTDGAPDIYDARLNGGFPASPAPTAECSGDACQGPLTNPAPLLVPGSAVQAAGENLTTSAQTVSKPTAKAEPKQRSTRKQAASHRRKHGKTHRQARAVKGKKGKR